MPMIECSECGATVSTVAKSCPGCGASRRVFRHQKRTGMSLAMKIMLGLFATGALMGLIFSNLPQPPRSKSEIAADQAESFRNKVAYDAVQTLRRNLRDPSSLAFEKITVDEAGSAVCMRYRAKNGFGGVGREEMLFIDGQPNQSPRSWNRHCVGKTMFDVTDVGDLSI